MKENAPTESNLLAWSTNLDEMKGYTEGPFLVAYAGRYVDIGRIRDGGGVMGNDGTFINDYEIDAWMPYQHPKHMPKS